MHILNSNMKPIEHYKKHDFALKKILDKGYIEQIANQIIQSINDGGKIIFCGNGGSASDCNHIAAEFVCKFEKKRNSLGAISLSNNSANLTSISNDFGFSQIFSRQIDSIAQQNDVLIAISTSGKSKNILNAISTALSKNINVILLTGHDYEDNVINEKFFPVRISSNNTAIIQECYMFVLHNVVRVVENKLF